MEKNSEISCIGSGKGGFSLLARMEEVSQLRESVQDMQGHINSFRQVVKMFEVMQKRSMEFVDDMEKDVNNLKKRIDLSDHNLYTNK